MGLLDIRDRVAATRDLVGCLYLACQQVPMEDDRAALSAVSHAARERLREIGEAIDDLISRSDPGWRMGDS